MFQRESYSKGELAGIFSDLGGARMQLPQGNMRMIDRVTKVSADGGRYGKGLVLAEFDIDPDLWFFDCHFPGDPIMPGCLGLDGLWQSLGFYLAWSGFEGKGRALGVGGVKFFGEVLPEARVLTYQIDVKRVVRRDACIAIGDGQVAVDGKPIYTAQNLRTCLVKDTSEII